MQKRTIFLGLGAIAALVLIAIPIILIPGQAGVDMRPVPAIADAEHAATIEAMRPPKRERPVIALITRNDGTEVADFLTSFGVLRRADVADVVVVAERAEPVKLYPARLFIDVDATTAAFDQQYPDGADYVVVPAMDPGTDPFIAAWIIAQYEKGAKIISVCNGSRMVGTAGLLDGRRSTGHWSAVNELRSKYPGMQYVADRRYVTDNGLTTSTGITASVPTMLALVEAIGGRDKAAEVAADLGVTTWDARHHSASFQLTPEHMKTFVRNTISIWRRERLGLPIADGVDEVALGLTSDAYSRTQLADVVIFGAADVRTAHGLVLHPETSQETANVGKTLALPSDRPGAVLEQVLPDISDRYDRQTADIVTLVMEYPWAAAAGQVATR